MKRVFYFIIASVAVALGSCKQEEVLVYNSGGKLQFGPIPQNPRTISDTLKSYTFYYKGPEKTMDTVFFDVVTQGSPASVDRTFALEQVNELYLPAGVTNAVAGTHYVPFNDAQATKNFVVKAGNVSARVPILLLRDASLKTNTVVLRFQIKANENFGLGEPMRLWRKVTFSDRLIQPTLWNTSNSLFNGQLKAYSVEKHQFMIEHSDVKWDNEYLEWVWSSPSENSTAMLYQLSKVKEALAAYNNTHAEPKSFTF